jgi:ArsR family transcriptional regulator, arsenate/arsenite/antimonite-responsive transcriptional repressor
VGLINSLKALSDETRFKLVNLLLKHDLCVGALAIRLNITESAVSQHLKVLRDAGIVRGDKRGYYTHYYVDCTVLKDIAEDILKLSRITPKDNRCHQAYLKENRPCSKKVLK